MRVYLLVFNVKKNYLPRAQTRGEIRSLHAYLHRIHYCITKSMLSLFVFLKNRAIKLIWAIKIYLDVSTQFTACNISTICNVLDHNCSWMSAKKIQNVIQLILMTLRNSFDFKQANQKPTFLKPKFLFYFYIIHMLDSFIALWYLFNKTVAFVCSKH